MRRELILSVALVLAGCAGWADSERQESFDTTTRAYAHAVQWSDFASIPVFLSPPPAAARFNPEAYRDFKITSYQPAAPQASPDGRTVRRSAAIGYVRLSQMREQVLTVQEEWAYSEEARRWYLHSGWPVLK